MRRLYFATRFLIISTPTTPQNTHVPSWRFKKNTCSITQASTHLYACMLRERQTDGKRDRQTERERDRGRETERDRQREIDRERDRQRQTETDRQTERETERQTHTHTERGRERESHPQRSAAASIDRSAILFCFKHELPHSLLFLLLLLPLTLSWTSLLSSGQES